VQFLLVAVSDSALVSCGDLRFRLKYLKETGFLDVKHIFYTSGQLRGDPLKLERQLLQPIDTVKTIQSTHFQIICFEIDFLSAGAISSHPYNYFGY
jgi:hypothetical protein